MIVSFNGAAYANTSVAMSDTIRADSTSAAPLVSFGSMVYAIVFFVEVLSRLSTLLKIS